MNKIKYKKLLPVNKFTAEVNTKMLPNKGNLVYEYNPLRNYRLNETRYQYNNRFYTEQELLNEQNIISNIIYIKSKNEVVTIARYSGDYKYENNDIKLLYLYTTFNIKNKIRISLPRYSSEEEVLYFSESELLNNSENVSLHVTYTPDGYSYLKTVNGRYVIGYDLENNTFTYGVFENAVKGVDNQLYVHKAMLNTISYSFKSNKFYQLLNNKIFEIKDRIQKFHPGSLVDFSTNELNFSLSHPVQILPQYSYDGSVNLILSDGYSKPKLINTRFSSTGKNTYQIVDRKGNNDTNIYDQGEQFEIDTSLYKLTSYIPKLTLDCVYQGGQLPVGNYHFYLTYADSDGNETDFIAESGLISIFIGNDPKSIRQGFRNENSFKGVKLLLSNIDPSYSYVNIYFTRSTGDILQNSETIACKLSEPIFISNTQVQEINITGYENTEGISLSDINPIYEVIESAETITTSKNMLFLGNVKKQSPDHALLSDLALYFTPRLDTSEEYNSQDHNYESNTKYTYQDPNYIYDKVGYWPEEIYRFGIVFIQADNTLTPVFNVRGINNLSEETSFKKYSLYDSFGNRQYIDINENNYLLVTGNTQQLENSKGVVRLHSVQEHDYNPVYGIKFEITASNKQEILHELSKVCKGYFFVRQRRIPTVLCEAMTIGVDKYSHHPCVPISGEEIVNLENKKSFKKNAVVKQSGGSTFKVLDEDDIIQYCPYSTFNTKSHGYIIESFMNNHRELTHDFEQHLRVLGVGQVDVKGMICPDYDLNYPYYNNIFNGGKFTIVKSVWQPKTNYLDINISKRHLYHTNYNFYKTNVYDKNSRVEDVKILGVEDSTPLVGINDTRYSGVAGISSMGYKFNYIGDENKTTEASNLVRGVWGPFLAIDSEKRLQPCTNYTIMIPGYNYDDIENYFKIRYSDKTAYYAISDRFLLKDIEQNEKSVVYRGDCYICQFTHRINRNFNDDTAPYNDIIVNPGTWRGENNGEDEDKNPNPGFEMKDGTMVLENFDHINLGDINAVKLGHWVTVQLRSSFNLNVRAIDDSDVSESIKIGHGKGFYPYFPMSAEGSYKIKEALCVNKGYEKSVSERYQFTSPDVPASKNIFCNRILHSEKTHNDGYKNGYRVFKRNFFEDYQLTYGSITKILEYQDYLFVVFEHGIGLLGVNERALLTNAASPNVYLQSDKVLSKDIAVISDCFGSQWKDSIIKTPYGIYGVDTSAKKIWKYDSKGLQIISDRTVQSFLNKNISLTERELTPILGIRNVKTHYNRFKNDVLFTFYDDLENVQEKVWNLCYNENFKQFITFYSWVPSYSDNIYNSFFTFDRQTSKWIAKIGQSNTSNDFSQDIVLKGTPILPDSMIDTVGTDCNFGELTMSNTDCKNIINVKLLRDNLQNFKLFNIIQRNNSYYLTLNHTTRAIDLVSELYYRTSDGVNKLFYKPNSNVTTDTTYGKMQLKHAIKHGLYFPIYHGSDNRRVELENPINKNKIVYILNLECTYETFSGGVRTINNSIAVTLKYNLQFLTTDFWRHGQAGIIDISEKLKPTHWYGKQHPFEFEFIMANTPSTQKIFDNLIILSNSAEPESFHYEIDGESYEFTKDKPNMYYRQEATEAFYQYNGQDIEFDSDFTEVKDQLQHKPLYEISKESLKEYDYKEHYKDLDITDSDGNQMYVKSNLLSLYYSRVNSYNEIEDYYRQQCAINKNYDTLSGAEIVRDHISNKYKIWSHAKGVNVNGPGGRLRGNMQYQEDRWLVQINPLNLRQKNEPKWGEDNLTPPIVVANSPEPSQIITKENDDLLSKGQKLNKQDLYPTILKNNGYQDINQLDFTNWESSKQVKLRDKYLRIRIRYSGKELAIIQAVQTLFRISYS